MSWKLATGAIVLGMALACSSSAMADRVYKTCETCNTKCHGACFMVGDGCNCVFGALSARKEYPARSRYYSPSCAKPASVNGKAGSCVKPEAKPQAHTGRAVR